MPFYPSDVRTDLVFWNPTNSCTMKTNSTKIYELDQVRM